MSAVRVHANSAGPASATVPKRRATHVVSGQHRLTLRGIIHGELIKMLSVPSSLVPLIALVPLSVGLMWLFVADKEQLLTRDPHANLDLALGGAGAVVPLSFLLVIIVAVLNVTPEYANGQIGVTHAIVPRRRMTVIAKASAVASVTWAVGFVSLVLGGAVAAAVVASMGGALPGVVVVAGGGIGGVVGAVLWVAAGGATALAAIGLIALCIGGVLRSTPFATAAAFGLVLVLPGLMTLAPVRWINELARILPEAASRSLYQTAAGRSALEGGIVLAATVLIGLGVWLWAIGRR